MSLLPLPQNLAALVTRPGTNASLFFDRGFDGFRRAGNRLEIPPNEKRDFLARFVTRPNADLSGLRNRRRQALEALGARPLVLFTQSRLVIGLGLPSSLETGFLLDRLTGRPYLPGSSLKGLARAAAWDASHGEPSEERSFWERNLSRILGPTTDEGSAQGTVAFFDAFPQGDARFEVDVLTPHHGEYYGNPEEKKPGDWENPTPVAFLTVAAGCAFEIFSAPAGPVRRRQERDLESALAILKVGLCDLGIGGKRAAGYGWFGEAAPEQPVSSPTAARAPRPDPPKEPKAKSAGETTWSNAEIELKGGALMAWHGAKRAEGERDLLSEEARALLRKGKRPLRADVVVTKGVGETMRIVRIARLPGDES